MQQEPVEKEKNELARLIIIDTHTRESILEDQSRKLEANSITYRIVVREQKGRKPIQDGSPRMIFAVLVHRHHVKQLQELEWKRRTSQHRSLLSQTKDIAYLMSGGK